MHRDLKSANIVVAPEGLVKVLDFGLAKRAGEGISGGAAQSFATIQDGSAVGGTLQYISPEVLRTQQSGDCAITRYAGRRSV